jgi:hypothetical protein
MKLSKREEKYRIKIFQEYHLDKKGQEKVDCFILKYRRYNYEKLYSIFKNAANAIQSIVEAYRNLMEPIASLQCRSDKRC